MSREYCEPVDIGDGVIIRARLAKPRSKFSDDEWSRLVDGLRAIHEAVQKRADQ